MEITTLRFRRFEYIIGFKDNTYTIEYRSYSLLLKDNFRLSLLKIDLPLPSTPLESLLDLILAYDRFNLLRPIGYCI